MLSNIYYGILNLYIYLPLIWKDRDWDWSYLAEMMEFKLRKMADHTDNHSYHLRSEIDAKQMKTCALLLNRVKREHYHDYIKDDWCPPIGPWRHRYGSERFDMKEHKCYDDYMIKQDLDLCMKIVGKYIRNWWC